MRNIWLGVLLVAAAASSFANLPAKFFGYLFVRTDPIVVEWDAVEGAEFYDVRMVYLDRYTTYNPVRVTVTQATLSRPRAGHFAVEVRPGTSTSLGQWSSSLNSTQASVDNEPYSWMLFWQLPAPGGVMID